MCSYNSAFYSSISVRYYDILIVGPNEQPYGTNKTDIPDGLDYDNKSHMLSLLASDTAERLDPQQCLDAYAAQYVTKRSNLILVSKNDTYEGDEYIAYAAWEDDDWSVCS